MTGKRYSEARKSIDLKKSYSLEEAMDLLKNTSKEKFDAGIEVHIKLGIDPKKGEQMVRGTIVLPHSVGKSKIIAAFVESNLEKEAKDAGADIVGSEELIKEIKTSGKINFDIAIATPSMMPKLAQIAKILGPKGLMPNPKSETVTPHIKKAIEELKKGKTTFKNDDTGNIHQLIGRVSLDKGQLLENFNVFIEAVNKVKPSSSKGVYLRNVVVCSTMGPGIKVGM
ncbi:50S ribosomal protein L1 [Candidatus Falkowbacteria bacterium RIFOXYB2_FULL_38_15]|uniref:Large ribosomal subunit protein uL1 n=1 Tax=Candidatus Falkowbacteria bacterium RIFOXYA2_FULL_38_12 TaxID=1797993 RepID=A0A1F5S2Y4_9BACT|nr:MAG: 50S ribosomal protein L1 [Candidatus Falkowbacteria bacterium RIFOXYA2_FULL_38_12]OGF32473.1 MAG: 50S ribosomal protein L1 [Candidatus Falkowbacteria bacterium RIFOXYB2_FULL_38_15]OGF42432.1 MAG: 50S ribosomal protein L1 [Candidatus Falkowbacteria bacterium RIFOXYD2_FULL_39_16]